MANLSKYFYQVIPGRTCADFAHPGKTCSEVRNEILPILLTGTAKYYLPIILLPAFAKYDKWTWEFWKNYLKVSTISVLCAGVLPGLLVQTSFCGLFNFSKKFYPLFAGIPIVIGTTTATMFLPTQVIEVMALGGCNHSMDFLVTLLKGTKYQILQDSIPIQASLFMACSAMIVYFLKTSKRRKFWLLNVQKPEEISNGESSGSKQKHSPWMDFLIKKSENVCKHEDSCDQHIWKEVEKGSKIGLIIGVLKVVITHMNTLKKLRIYKMPFYIWKNLEYDSLLFMVLYCGSFKFFNCFLNRLTNTDTIRNTMASGFLSGIFYGIYPKFIMLCFAIMRSFQMAWLKHVSSYKGNNSTMQKLKNIPMRKLIFFLTTTSLFAGRIYFPHLTSKYIVMVVSYMTGTLSEVFVANFYGILMGLQ